MCDSLEVDNNIATNDTNAKQVSKNTFAMCMTRMFLRKRLGTLDDDSGIQCIANVNITAHF